MKIYINANLIPSKSHLFYELHIYSLICHRGFHKCGGGGVLKRSFLGSSRLGVGAGQAQEGEKASYR